MFTYIVIEKDNCSASLPTGETILTNTKEQLHDILERLGAFEQSTAPLANSGHE